METRISSSSSGLSSNGWRREGSPDWWLRKGTEGGEFIDVPRIEGRRSFFAVLDLEPGVYQLGVGKRRPKGDYIREKIEVVPCATGCGRGTEKRMDRFEGDAQEQKALGILPHSFCRDCDQAVLAGIVFGLAGNFVESACLLKEIGPKYLDGYEASQDATAGEWG